MNEEMYETDRTRLAAFLVYCGHPVQQITFRGDIGCYHFKVAEGLHERVATFLEGKALVEPQSYSRAYGDVRNAMFAHKDRRRGL